MNEYSPPAWNDPSEDLSETVLSFSIDAGDGAPAACSADFRPGSLRWHEQEAYDDFADEVLAWASAEEAVLADRNA